MNINNVKKMGCVRLCIVLPSFFLMTGLATPTLAQQENLCESSTYSQKTQTEQQPDNQGFSGIFHLIDSNNNPLANIPYQVIEPGGKIIARGLTDQNGKTVTVYSHAGSEAKILITLATGKWMSLLAT